MSFPAGTPVVGSKVPGGAGELPLLELCPVTEMAQPAVCHTPGEWECIEGKGGNSSKMHRETKTAKGKGAAAGKASLPNSKVPTGMSNPNGFAPFHLFIP